jgi:ABC-type branched-subunit amino acid transport system substrate-binding protein
MKGFYERFREVNDAEAPFQAVQVYDAIRLLARAAHESAAGEDTGADPVSVAQAIEATTDFQGAGVPLTFSADDHEGVGIEDMAILAFTTDQAAAGGEFAPDISTGGGFFTIDTQTIDLPSELTYLLEGLPA